ncbi:hypothetical protein [Sphingobacterium ginsenosidimutans]|uniref:Uncharacterized protein n=1 Tax=Sphingobacterium ginsenosidimutans TaxID=687845 RepID=A0ABP8A9Q9_9SPHI
MVSEFIKNKHLANRAGFGISLEKIATFERQSTAEVWQSYARARDFEPISFNSTDRDADYAALSTLDAVAKKQIQQRNRQRNIEINLNFLTAMVHSEDQLRGQLNFAGDLVYSEDFRKVYATLLKNWLGADSSKILGWKNGVYDFI